MSGGDSRRQARSLIDADAVSLAEVWIRYWGQGGNADLLELDAFIHGVPLLDDFDAVVLGWALEGLSLP